MVPGANSSRGADMKKHMPYLLGAAIAAILYIVPEAKPIACGLGFALPFSVG